MAELCALQFEQLGPKLVNKDGVPVTYNGFRQPMQLMHLIKEDYDYLLSIIGVFKRNEVGIFREFVYHHQNGVFVFKEW